MQFDEDRMYRALLEKDATFEGDRGHSNNSPFK
jgi:hypothetical protein